MGGVAACPRALAAVAPSRVDVNEILTIKD